MKGLYFIGGFVAGFITGAIVIKYYMDNSFNDVEYYQDIQNDPPKPMNVDPAAFEHPEDDEEDEGFQQFMSDVEDQYKNSSLPPIVISESEVQEMSDKEVIDFLYHDSDGIMLDMQDHSIIDQNDLPRFIGDCLDKSGFSDNDQEVLYVHNLSQDTIYCINKIKGSYDPYGGGDGTV